MTLTQNELDPSLVVGDSLIEARELASNFAHTAEQERENSPQAGRLAGSVHEVLRLYFIGDGGFVRDGEPGTPQPESQSADISEVTLVVGSFRDLIDQRRVSRQEASTKSRIDQDLPSFATV
ncbi:MAG TPA: hypothetical protein VMR34_05710 [Candidatus Saccharimonadales bacterium]|nr:hypothetical protein [Candidatus Saccharimonadales bacterium]